MKSKITILKDILKIVILIFVIFSAIKSCSRASDNDDIIEYIGKLEDKGLLEQGCTGSVTTFINSNSYNNSAWYFIGISGSDSNYLPNRLFICNNTNSESIIIKNKPSSTYWNSYSASNSSKGIFIKYGDLSWDTISSSNARWI